MKMLKYKFIPVTIILAFISVSSVFSQDTTSVDDYYTPGLVKPADSTSSGFVMSAGAFSTVSNGNSYFGTFLRPGYRLSMTNRLSLTTGFQFTSFSLPSSLYAEGTTNPRTLTQTLFYMQGEYQLNKNVFVTGGFYTSLPNNGSLSNTNSVKGGSLGLGVNLNNSSSLYFEVQINKGNHPFYNGYNSPFQPGMPLNW